MGEEDTVDPQIMDAGRLTAVANIIIAFAAGVTFNYLKPSFGRCVEYQDSHFNIFVEPKMDIAYSYTKSDFLYFPCTACLAVLVF